MHVVALLPRNLLAHLRVVLREAHSLDAVVDAAELHSILQSGSADLLIVDPALRDGQYGEALEEIIASHASLPVVIYTVLSPTAIRMVVRLARLNVQHVVLNRFDDEPRRFLDLIERIPAHPMAELMLQELSTSLRRLPVAVARAVEHLFRSPTRIRNSQEVANLAGMSSRSLYRHMTPAGLHPRNLIVCARLLRAYTLLRTPGSRLKEITTKVGYSDPDTLTKLLHEWSGRSAKDIRRDVSPELFVRLLAEHLRRVDPEQEVDIPA